LQNKLQATAAKLVEVSDGTVSESMDDRNGLDASFKYLTQESAILMLQKLPINQYVEFVNRNMEEHAIHDTLSFIKLVTDQIMYEFRSQGLAKDRKSSKYLKYKALPAVQNLAEMICSPAVSVGAALLFDGTVQIPRIEETFEDVATRLLPESEFSSIEQLLSAATILIGTEFSFEPIVRKFARLVFKNRGTISTRPTTKGETAITPFSQFFGIHYIDQKPVSQFFSEEGLLQFMNMIEAESLGLIQILINAPQKSIDGKLIIDLEPFFGEGLRLFEFFMPREHASLDPNPKARMSWDFIRLNVLQVTIEKYLIPFLRSDLKSELLRLGKEVIADKVALSFEKRLSYGPCEPYFEDNREFLTRTLLNCPGRFCYSKVASLFVTQDRTPGLHMACVDSNGVLVAHQVIAPQSMGQKKDKIKAFLYDNRPELVVINSSAASLGREISGLVGKQILEEITETIELDRQLRRSQSNRDGFDDNNEEEDEEDDERNRKYSPNVFSASFLDTFFKFSIGCDLK
jgi:transcriptional accessory protein Tex/SPT6